MSASNDGGRPGTTEPDSDQAMRDADVANGEDPDAANRSFEGRGGRSDRPGSTPTGERQAKENRENDPPA